MKDVIEAITTTFERDLLLTFLDQFDQLIFNSNVNVKSFIEEKSPLRVRHQLLQYFALDISSGSTQGLELKARELEDMLKKNPVLVITIAKDVSGEFIDSIALSVREIAGLPVFLDVKTDFGIAGGAVIENKGKIVEYSFRKYFQNKNGL